MSKDEPRKGDTSREDPSADVVIEKPNDFKNTSMKLIRYCGPFIPMIAVALSMAFGAAILDVICPEWMKILTDEIAKGLPMEIDGTIVLGAISMDVILSIAILLAVFYTVSAIMTFVQNRIMATVTQKISKKMRADISQKINRLPFSYFNKASYGDILSRMTNDVDTIGTTMNQSIAILMSAVITFVGSLIMMFITSWMMAVTAISASLFGFGFMFLIIRSSQKYFVAQQNELGNINGYVEEVYTGHDIVKIFNAGKEFKEKFEKINARLYESGWKSQFFSGLMMPLMSFVGNFGYLAVCVVGAALKMNGTISFGVIVAFIVYVRLFTWPLSQFAQAATSLQMISAASGRVFEFLEEKELKDESQKLKRIDRAKGDVEFRNVRFGYTPEKVIIRDFSAKVKTGQKVAIVGPTGAGKTTLVNLLMRFYEVDCGEILLDGISIKEVPRENVHEQFCMVLQDTWLFKGTIKENIIYSKEGVSDEDVTEACKTVGLHHFIMTLPNKYDTVLDDTGISDGQMQLITIARAIIKDSPLLILDEATSSVDTRTECIVQKAMDNLTKGRTSFVIAHRLSTIKDADIIMVINEGSIMESGTHSELLLHDGFYAELYKSQFELVDNV
ncbi:MAG: ABC transporter ATP-binding protein/permease [Candidatus Methanoplasma sp.]|jgi:ATP-binding cassette subfamily B protein|nr:ABC transporter ATP-binding protein/permease [Candidatus Methanoplasma sp.]